MHISLVSKPRHDTRRGLKIPRSRLKMCVSWCRVVVFVVLFVVLFVVVFTTSCRGCVVLSVVVVVVGVVVTVVIPGARKCSFQAPLASLRHFRYCSTPSAATLHYGY